MNLHKYDVPLNPDTFHVLSYKEPEVTSVLRAMRAKSTRLLIWFHCSCIYIYVNIHIYSTCALQYTSREYLTSLYSHNKLCIGNSAYEYRIAEFCIYSCSKLQDVYFTIAVENS